MFVQKLDAPSNPGEAKSILLTWPPSSSMMLRGWFAFAEAATTPDTGSNGCDVLCIDPFRACIRRRQGARIGRLG